MGSLTDSVSSLVNSYLEESKRILDGLPFREIASAIDLIWKALKKNSSVHVFGNGGTAALESHSATNVAKRAKDVDLATSVAVKRLKVFLARKRPIFGDRVLGTTTATNRYFVINWKAFSNRQIWSSAPAGPRQTNLTSKDFCRFTTCGG